jgi:hypothetical protein
MNGSISPDGKWKWDGEQWIPNIPKRTNEISDSVIQVNVENKITGSPSGNPDLSISGPTETINVNLTVFMPGIKFMGFSILSAIIINILSDTVDFGEILTDLSKNMTIENEELVNQLTDIEAIIGSISELLLAFLTLSILTIGLLSIVNINFRQAWKITAILLPIYFISTLLELLLDLVTYDGWEWARSDPSPYPLIFAISILIIYSQHRPENETSETE